MTTTQYEHAPAVHAALTCTVMICNTAIRIANAWIQHSVLRHNATAGTGATSFLNWPDAIENVEVP